MPDPLPPYVLSLDEAIERLGDIETVTAGSAELRVARPASYAAKPTATYPLLILVGADGWLGSAIEMTRLMAQTGELRETLIVATPGTPDARLVDELGSRYRVAEGSPLVYAPGAPLGGDVSLDVIGADATPAGLLPTLVSGLRARLSTGKPYAREAPLFRYRPLVTTLSALRPLFGRIAARRRPPLGPETRFLIRAAALDRAFEVFAVLPRSAAIDPARRFPAWIVLDASIELSVVAETAARLADAGTIPELITVGLGVPRREGTQAAGFRRFEEFAPPTDGYAFDDDLGKIFRSLFALVGRDARVGVDRAPDLLRFLVDELLPRLERELPIDPADVGLLGHSAGGTFVLYALHAGAPFRRFIAISPGIGVSGSWLTRTVDGRAPLAPPTRDVHLSFGSEERFNAFNRIAGIPDTEPYAERLRARDDVRVRSTVLDGETHSSVFPRAVALALSEVHGPLPEARD